MKILIQRVSYASVKVDDVIIGEIDQGLLALIGFEKADAEKDLNKIINRLVNYRVFSDQEGKMNDSLKQIGGGLLLVPQFTLAADTQKGLRPSFASAMPIPEAVELFDRLKKISLSLHDKVAFGEFGADMKVLLLNDGPVTFSLSY